MEQKLPLISKKVLSLILFMLKKGISKAKILNKLLFHNHHATFHRHLPPSGEYQFTCRDTPLSLFSTHRLHMTPPDHNNNNNNITVMKALEDMLTSATSSPGYVKSPVVRQLRIMDSTFPLTNGDEDGQVDEAADKFITRFYNDLRRETK